MLIIVSAQHCLPITAATTRGEGGGAYLRGKGKAVFQKGAYFREVLNQGGR